MCFASRVGKRSGKIPGGVFSDLFMLDAAVNCHQ